MPPRKASKSKKPRTGTDLKDQQAARFGNNMRTLFRKGQLCQEKQDLLNGVEGWSWDAQSAKWQLQYESLVREMAKSNHRVPVRGDKKNSRSAQAAAVFAMHQRQLFHKHKLPENRTELLQQIDGWTWTAPSADTISSASRRRGQPLKRPAASLQTHARR